MLSTLLLYPWVVKDPATRGPPGEDSPKCCPTLETWMFAWSAQPPFLTRRARIALDERGPPSLKSGTVALVLRKLALQRGPVHVALLIPEDCGALMNRRRIVMAASRV